VSYKVLHVIEQLSLGGAGRSAIALISALQKHSDILHANAMHRVLSLKEPPEKAMNFARELGLDVLLPSSSVDLNNLVAESDIVQVHFWNSPEIYQFLNFELPAHRRIIWSHVNGATRPHCITSELLDNSEYFVSSTPQTLRLESVQQALQNGCCKVQNILEACNFSQLETHNTECRTEADRFVVGYIGTVSDLKMHPRFVALSSGVNISNVKFSVYGSGDGFRKLQQQAIAAGVSERFEFCGYVENVAQAFRTFDVFGYPLCEDNYSTSELIVQEALFLGVPTVVFNYGGAAELILDGTTGLVVKTDSEYQQAIEYLSTDSNVRARLGANAKLYARENLGADYRAAEFAVLYSEVLASNKKVHKVQTETTGAKCFVGSLGEQAAEFEVALQSSVESELRAAEEMIAKSTKALSSADSGGVINYRNSYPDDPFLRLWSGLILEQQGRVALAAREYQQALALGISANRVEEYLQRCKETSNVKRVVNA